MTSLFISPAFAQTDPQVGVWKLNIAKSKYSPGPAPKSGTTKVEAVGAGAKVSVDQVAADGTTRHWEFTANYDGKDAPITGNNPDADTVACTRINANTVQTVSKKAGKVTATQQSVVSADGKTRKGHDQGCQCDRAASEQRRRVRQAVSGIVDQLANIDPVRRPHSHPFRDL